MNTHSQEIYGFITLAAWITFLVAGLFGSFYTLNQLNDFQQTTSQIVRRYGGATTPALKAANSVSKYHYGGQFQVYATDNNTDPDKVNVLMSSSKQPTGGPSVPYGDTIVYVIHVKIPVLGKTGLSNHIYETVADIRQDSQN